MCRCGILEGDRREQSGNFRMKTDKENVDLASFSYVDLGQFASSSALIEHTHQNLNALSMSTRNKGKNYENSWCICSFMQVDLVYFLQMHSSLI